MRKSASPKFGRCGLKIERKQTIFSRKKADHFFSTLREVLKLLLKPVHDQKSFNMMPNLTLRAFLAADEISLKKGLHAIVSSHSSTVVETKDISP